MTVLSDWATAPGGWASRTPDALARPAGVVTMPSRTRPELIESLGNRISSVGRIPLFGSLAYTDQADALSVPRSNSAQRLRALSGALVVPPSLQEALHAADGPVLLVDDLTETGWTLAVAGRLLLQSGAQGVLPLVLAVRS